MVKMQHDELDPEAGAQSAGNAGYSSGGGVQTAYLTNESAASASAETESDEQTEASATPSEENAEPTAAGLVPTFLHEIARTMQATADRERERIAADIAESLDTHVETVRSRASTEVVELKRLAEEDVDRIHQWSAAENDRLRRETESRIGARRQDLERHLRQHDALVEREIARAKEAVEEYQAELSRFVGRLASEQEPTEIARLASLLPEPPHVEEIASAARAAAIAQLTSPEAPEDASAAPAAPTEGGLVGVMSPNFLSRPSEPKAQESLPALQSAPAPESSPAPESAPPPESLSALERPQAEMGAITSEDEADEPVDQEQQGGILGAWNTADLVIRLVSVVVIVAIIATLAWLVLTGQVLAASIASLALAI
jgi:hypothetical protein